MLAELIFLESIPWLLESLKIRALEAEGEVRLQSHTCNNRYLEPGFRLTTAKAELFVQYLFSRAVILYLRGCQAELDQLTVAHV
jgi:hypothetical protein